ncbi:thiamine pyrophosphate-binding protein [Myxococcota bacterium]|nr:thiamine pyrophosphate-binding protein [Myxococcota bacterium]
MAQVHGGVLAARQLKRCGIDTLFGVVAGPMIELFSGGQSEGLQVVGCRHEINGGFMASAWGWQKKVPGVFVAGSGPAVTNCVTPLYVANESAMPFIVLGGSAYSNTTGLGGFQELDQISATRSVCKWTGRVDSTERIPEWIHLAVGKALEGRPGGVYLDFPGDVVAAKVEENDVSFPTAPEIAAPHPDPEAVLRIADLLSSAERPLILVGKGAAWSDAGPAIQKLVDLGIPYVCSPMGRGTLPDDHPNFANAARSQALSGADVIVMFGGRFNWIFGMGRRFAPDATIVQVDVQPEELTSGAEISLGVTADARATAEALSGALSAVSLSSSTEGWLKSLQEKVKRNEEGLRSVQLDDSQPINPYRVVAEIKQALPRDATVTAEGETTMGICRAMLPSFVNRSRFNAGTTGSMGVGVPYTVGASLACPDRLSVGVLGDYAFGSAAIAVETAARVGAKPLFVVLNNEGIAGHMLQDNMLPANSPMIASLLPARYEKIAEMVDGHAEYVVTPDEIRPALDRAMASGKLAVVHVRVDPKASRMGGSNYLQ